MEEKTIYSESELYAMKSIEHVKEVLNKTKDNYIVLGRLLSEAKTYFKDIPGKNYKNFKIFAKKEFGLANTTTKDYVRVYERCCENMKLKERFQPFSYTQLRELSRLKDEQMDLANSNMSPEEIRALGKIGVDEDVVLSKYISSPTSFVETYFKNNEDRSNFLDTYAEWELFKMIPELTLKFFRIQLTDDSYLIVTESEYNCQQMYTFGVPNKCAKDIKYTILNPKDKYSRYMIDGMSRSSIINHLSKNKLGYLKIVRNEE